MWILTHGHASGTPRTSPACAVAPLQVPTSARGLRRQDATQKREEALAKRGARKLAEADPKDWCHFHISLQAIMLTQDE